MSVQSFSAVCYENTRTLILGSMPGVASLNAIEYYAHKRNAFWPILIAITEQQDISYALPTQYTYQERLGLLNAHGFGLWDVLAQCERKGSLDSAIVTDSVVVNDMQGLLVKYPHISKIAFNGKAAQRLFKKHISPTLAFDEQNFVSLPSSSPAMASLSLEQKLNLWREALL